MRRTEAPWGTVLRWLLPIPLCPSVWGETALHRWNGLDSCTLWFLMGSGWWEAAAGNPRAEGEKGQVGVLLLSPAVFTDVEVLIVPAFL